MKLPTGDSGSSAVTRASFARHGHDAECTPAVRDLNVTSLPATLSMPSGLRVTSDNDCTDDRGERQLSQLRVANIELRFFPLSFKHARLRRPAGRSCGQRGFTAQPIPTSDTVYDLSKLLGEALCPSQPQATVRVARLSNIVGSGQSEHTFLGALLSEVRRDGHVVVREAPLSSKITSRSTMLFHCWFR